MIGGMPDEQDELEQAWQALADRERLLNQTIARRSSEIDARARRYEGIGADLDARRQLIEEAEDELGEREQKLGLAEEALRDREAEIERAEAEVERLRQQARELDVRASELRVLASELEERGDWIATASAAL
jgi:chromosome segregation ATPase